RGGVLPHLQESLRTLGLRYGGRRVEVPGRMGLVLRSGGAGPLRSRPADPAALRPPRDLLRTMDVGRLFEAHHEALYRYLYRLTGDPELAADAVQEAFTRMIARRPRDENPRAWLYR